ncbi:DUF1203 domain-containing protein [Altererythrobacter salegens]|uniref:DUF1203 domain-containing protein n=1 Tax=Croceibacterium salegens TaxID=1737568 RepID=A0A6I4SRU9_9SPHN|nr:DUF1203 domain-containing protein [Croceibacterium salegens]MXO58603.1 DUF1203 domain-containing protein [Croceibacterium salegens]
MTYKVTGLDRSRFAPLFVLDDEALARHGARRVVADADHGFPCRVTLEDARAGESLLLVNHASNRSDGPYHSAFAVFVREDAGEAARYVDALPPVFIGRPLGIRAYDAVGDLVAARLSTSEATHEDSIRELLADPRVDHLDAHNAAHGCFAARIDRYRSEA